MAESATNASDEEDLCVLEELIDEYSDSTDSEWSKDSDDEFVADEETKEWDR